MRLIRKYFPFPCQAEVHRIFVKSNPREGGKNIRHFVRKMYSNENKQNISL